MSLQSRPRAALDDDMNPPNTPSERLLQLFVPLMEGDGYSYRKTNHRFIKKFASGTYEFSLMFDARSGLVGVDAGFFVHFDALEKQFKKALGYECSWSAGATLLNAGANPWKFFLNEERFAAMQPAERIGIPSDVIHPQARIEACVRFLQDAHTRYALPLFGSLETVRQLADFLGQYLRDGCSGRCRPLAENAVYLWLLAAGALGDNLDEIVAVARKMRSHVGPDVDLRMEKVIQFMMSDNP